MQSSLVCGAYYGSVNGIVLSTLFSMAVCAMRPITDQFIGCVALYHAVVWESDTRKHSVWCTRALASSCVCCQVQSTYICRPIDLSLNIRERDLSHSHLISILIRICIRICTVQHSTAVRPVLQPCGATRFIRDWLSAHLTSSPPIMSAHQEDTSCVCRPDIPGE